MFEQNQASLSVGNKVNISTPGLLDKKQWNIFTEVQTGHMKMVIPFMVLVRVPFNDSYRSIKVIADSGVKTQ